MTAPGFTEAIGYSSPKLNGDLQLNNHNIRPTTSLTSDHTVSGEVVTGTIGQSGGVSFGDALFLKSDGEWYKADASDDTLMPVHGIAAESGSEDGTIDILIRGFIRDDSWLWTVGQLIFASINAGEISQSIPESIGEQVQALGWAFSGTTIYFNPSPVLVEVLI
jgi:hypothetical protein